MESENTDEIKEVNVTQLKSAMEGYMFGIKIAGKQDQIQVAETFYDMVLQYLK